MPDGASEQPADLSLSPLPGTAFELGSYWWLKPAPAVGKDLRCTGTGFTRYDRRYGFQARGWRRIGRAVAADHRPHGYAPRHASPTGADTVTNRERHYTRREEQPAASASPYRAPSGARRSRWSVIDRNVGLRRAAHRRVCSRRTRISPQLQFQHPNAAPLPNNPACGDQ